MIYASEKKSRKIRHAFAEHLEPRLIASSFQPRPLVHDRWPTGPQPDYDYRSYHRKNANSMDLCRIHFWRYGYNFHFQRYGGAFGLEFAQVPLPFAIERVDLISEEVAAYNEVIEPEDVTLDMCAQIPKGAILGSPDATTVQRHLFRYNHIWEDQQALSDLVRVVAGYLPQMEKWFVDKQDGPNVGTERRKV